MSSHAGDSTHTPCITDNPTDGDTESAASHAQDAIPGLLNDIVVTHVLRPEHFDDPADLARLPAVSRAMRDAVAETGILCGELDEDEAVALGCLSALQRRQRGGRLSRRESLCEAAARSGQLDELKVLRSDGCPWDKGTCISVAARGRHLGVLQWARANGCAWDEYTCSGRRSTATSRWACANGCPLDEGTCRAAAEGGHLEVLQWARANGCPWNLVDCMALASANAKPDVFAWLGEKNNALNRNYPPQLE